MTPAAALPAPPRFDYAQLRVSDRRWLSRAEKNIRVRFRRSAADLVEVGRLLLEAKERLGHGKFGDWLIWEIGLSWPTAGKLMRVAKAFDGRIIPGDQFDPTALYLLASPSTPPAATNAALALVGGGQPVTAAVARRLLDELKPGTVSESPRGVAIVKDVKPPTPAPEETFAPDNWRSLEALMQRCHMLHITVEREDGDAVFVGWATTPDGQRRSGCRGTLADLVLHLADAERRKKCNRCKAVKRLEEFSAEKDSPDGRNCYCLECERRRVRAYDRRKRGADQ